MNERTKSFIKATGLVHIFIVQYVVALQKGHTTHCVSIIIQAVLL